VSLATSDLTDIATYTATRNSYADAKVENNLTPSTTVAPAKDAVIAGLVLKEDIIDYLQQPLFNFNFNQSLTAPLQTASIASGTLITQSDSVGMPERVNRTSDIVECWTIRGNGGGANGGFTIGVASQNPIYVGSTIFVALEPIVITDTNIRIGLLTNNATPPTTSLAGSNAMCVEILGNQLTFKTSETTGGISSAPSYTIPSAQWLYIMFEVESTTSIRCKVRLGLTGTLVYNELITSVTNTPISFTGTSWKQLRISMNAIRTIASGVGFVQFGKFATYAKKPNFVKFF